MGSVAAGRAEAGGCPSQENSRFATEITARRGRNQNESELMKRSWNKQENRKHRKTSKWRAGGAGSVLPGFWIINIAS